MKRVFLVRLAIFLGMIIFAVRLSAQHFISIQSDNKQPFTIQVNGISFNSTKAGAVRISNLSGGSYNLVISLAGKKYPPQNFTCSIDKSDESYALKNDSKKGWILKNLKSTEVIASSTPQTPADQPVAKNDEQLPPKASAFAQMLSQVIDDPELLKTTPWILSTKTGEPAAGSVADMTAEEKATDTVAYVPDTKGVIKAVEHTVKDGTELVFVDFNAAGGDTIHIVIPSSENDGANDTAAAQVQNLVDNSSLVKTDTTVTQQAINPLADKNPDSTQKADSPTVNTKPADNTEQVPAFDTSGNKQMGNPFFKGNTSAKKDDNKVVSNNDTSAQAENVKPVQQPVTKAVPAVRQDCKKMLSDNDAEKLKHKIYLETDEDKIMDITSKALSGKCINTAQVKQLASFFLSDEARYKFFRTVYPNVYDSGNFATLESFMIDRKYKSMFHDLIK